MKNIFVLLLLSASFVNAQDTTIFAPAGAKWSYNSWSLFNPPPDLLTFISEGEIVLNDTTARIIRSYQTVNAELEYMPGNDKYIYTSGNKVYHWVEDGFYLLFDFGAAPGDTISSRAKDFPISLSCAAEDTLPISFMYVIDSVGTIIVNGETLRTQYVTNIPDSLDYVKWVIENPVERFGQFSWSSYWWGRGPNCLLGGIPGELRCYEDDDILFINPYTFFDLPCDYVSATESVDAHVNLIHPNPALNYFELPFIADVISIYNSSGKKMVTIQNQSRIDVSGLQPNLYLVEYQVNNTRYISKFVKM